MSDQSDAWNTDIIKSSNERIAVQARIVKFQMFFSGLIFATISFIGTHPLQTAHLYLKFFEVIALFSLLISGIILLARLSGAQFFRGKDKQVCFIKKVWLLLLDIIFNRDKYYWSLFILGMVMIVLDRSIMLFYS